MGYAWNGTCYQDTAAALNAFAAQVPSVSPSGINAFAGVPAIGGGGLISWSITNRPLDAADSTLRTGTTQLLSCSNEGLEQWPIQSILFYLALAFAVFAGFRTGFRP